MKRREGSALMRVALAAALVFVLAGLVPTPASAQGNQSHAQNYDNRFLTDAPSASQSGNIIYIVKPGDTLARIAARYRVTLQAILRANPSIRNPNRIYIGQRILIPTGSPGTPGDKNTIQVNIYLIGMGSGKVGCGDAAVAVRRNVPATRAPLTAALNELLSLHDQFYGQSGLYNALYQSRLSVQRITRQDTTWIVRLQGTLQLSGVCDIPRVEAQLRQTALQFPTVKQVFFFVNGVPLKDALSQK